MSRNKKIILTALLLAAQILLSRFLSIRTPITKISFAFLPTCLCAIWLGPKWTVLLNVLGDVIGALLFPTGAYFFGYTVTTFVAGLIYGLLMYKKEGTEISEIKFALKVTLAVCLVTIICNMGLNTLWTSITSGKAFMALFVTRVPKQLIMVPIHIVVVLFVERILRKPFDKYFDNENLQ